MRADQARKPRIPDPATLEREITEEDLADFARITSFDLDANQRATVATPPAAHPGQSEVLALHWHPEFVPLDLIRARIDAAFPRKTDELIIPTQHNELESYDGFTGVEVDCHSPEFNRKTQLLVHFASGRLDTPKADIFKSILTHTFKYRSGQLFDFLETLLDERHTDRMEEAAAQTGAEEDLVEFVRVHVRKLADWLDENRVDLPPGAIKNKLIRDYFNLMRSRRSDALIDRCQVFLKAVKEIVKRGFSLEYFYNTREVIEEVRSLGGCIVIPHPEQFWPILLAGYDVDAIEVWNPQSLEYTDFLINVVNEHNAALASGKRGRRLLVTMGDDCHMGEKVKDPRFSDREKARREIGFQPAWDDLTIRKSLIRANFSRRSVMEEYRARLLG